MNRSQTPSAAAEKVSEQLFAAVPADYARVLRPQPGDAQLTATSITDPDWLADQINLRAEIWNVDDQHVLATLWWYSASNVIVTPSLLSFLAVGVAFSPRLEDLVLHHDPSSQLHGSHSLAIIDGGIDQLAAALQDSLSTVIEAVAAFTKGRPAPLWAIATDAIANRLLWAGQSTNDVDAATAIARPLARKISPKLPAPHYVDVEASDLGEPPGRPQSRRFVHRTSCCLLYRVPNEAMCTSCPRRPRLDREQRLRAAASRPMSS
jgi:ferric iron reductase protein FhuF